MAWAALRWRSELAPLLVIAALYPFLFALSPYSWYVAEPRYLLLLSPVPALVLGCLLARWRFAAVGLAAALALTIAGLPGIAPNLPYPDSDAGLIAALRSRGIHAAFGDYWASYRLTFETREQIVVSPVSNVRYLPDDALVRRQPAPAYVYFTGTLPEYQFLVALGNLGVAYQKFTVDAFTVYLPAAKVVPPSAGAPPGPVQLDPPS